jgi:hypothetical protein
MLTDMRSTGFCEKMLKLLVRHATLSNKGEIKEGGSARYGTQAGPSVSPVLERISERIDELLTEAKDLGP